MGEEIDIKAIVQGLEHPDMANRMRALAQLEPLVYGRFAQSGLPLEQGLAILRAVQLDWPESSRRGRRPRQVLLLALSQLPYAEYLPGVIAVYPQLAEDENSRWQALTLLSSLPQREAAEIWLKWYREELRAGKGTLPPFGRWSREGLHADLLLPALLEFAQSPDPSLSRRWYEYIHQYLAAENHGETVQGSLIRAYEAMRPSLLAAQRSDGIAWMWSGAYMEERLKASRLLQLLGYLPKEVAAPVLRTALGYSDPRLLFAAAISLLRLREVVPPEVMVSIAASSEMRGELWRALHSWKRDELFPGRFSTQPLMAESDMVEWLIADTDMAPERIELLGVSVTHGRYYVFGFQLHGYEDQGWMAGISGPWLETGLGKEEACGSGTFSDFKPVDSASTDGHVQRMLHRAP